MPELTRRYIVMTMATEGPFDMRDPDAAFVLKPWKDPAALRAIETYQRHCYPELAGELAVWIQEISSGPTVRGGVGGRNERHMASRSKPLAKRTSARPHRAKAQATVIKIRRLKRKAKRARRA
jgi:hypothetical protein